MLTAAPPTAHAAPPTTPPTEPATPPTIPPRKFLHGYFLLEVICEKKAQISTLKY